MPAYLSSHYNPGNPTPDSDVDSRAPPDRGLDRASIPDVETAPSFPEVKERGALKYCGVRRLFISNVTTLNDDY
jgi:hypothetical protein